MVAFKRFVLPTSYLLLFFTGTLTAKPIQIADLPIGQAPAEGQTIPIPETAGNEAATPDALSRDSIGGEAVTVSSTSAEPGTKVETYTEAPTDEPISGRSLSFGGDDADSTTTRLITDYMKRMSAIKKFIRVYEEIIKKIDKSLEGVARKLAGGLLDLTNFMKNIRAPEEIPSDTRHFNY